LQCRVDAGLPAVAGGAKLLHHIARKADGDAFLGGGSLRSAHAQFALQGGRQFSGRLQAAAASVSGGTSPLASVRRLDLDITVDLSWIGLAQADDADAIIGFNKAQHMHAIPDPEGHETGFAIVAPLSMA
jgi:hypothetical protein